MQVLDGNTVYSATDLVAFLECRHLADLERSAAIGTLSRPNRVDPILDRIAERGDRHEKHFLETLHSDSIDVVEIRNDKSLRSEQRILQGRKDTLAAMRDGSEAIYQAVLFDGQKLGYADFLLRVEKPSDLGPWSYEVWDTKLARHAKATAVLQLCMYSELLGAVQGQSPERMHLALGGVRKERVSFRVADYAAYYRLVRRNFEAELKLPLTNPLETTPEPVEHCDMCRWSSQCQTKWRKEDDLTLVADLSARQRRALLGAGVTTRTGLAEIAKALPGRLDDVSPSVLSKLHLQAEIQVRGERVGATISERIELPRDREGELIQNHGLLMLPEPSPGDLFFDIEGDPFFSSHEVDGIEYLFGVIEPGRRDPSGGTEFHTFWSIDDATVTTRGERQAFEDLVDFLMDRLEADPKLHIYHYAPYEPTAMKRLAGRYGTRESEIDQLLRGGVFVDLYRAVRQGIRGSVESYSLKRLEPLYNFKREIDLRDAGTSIVQFETWLELGEGKQRSELVAEIERYNRDDCLSIVYLRDWLEDQRTELAIGLGQLPPRPNMIQPEEREDSETQKQVNEVVFELSEPLPESFESMTNDQKGRWLLAQLLNWHRRENKSLWWRYFFLVNELTDAERREEADSLGELTYENSWPDPTPRSRSNIYRFNFPRQEHDIRIGTRPRDPESGMTVGEVVELDDEQGTIDLKLGSNRPVPSPTSLISDNIVLPKPKPESLLLLAKWVLGNGIEGRGRFEVARDLLTRSYPRFENVAEGAKLRHETEDAQDAARRLVKEMDGSYLAIQGPPGSGKSTVGARMIVDLLEKGQRVGVTANSHKVIGELLAKAAGEARARSVAARIGQRSNANPTYIDAVHLKKNEEARDSLADGKIDLVGGTTWLWSREDMTESIDVLFIDEAGQMSLADTIAASSCARSLVLLGDPQQLDQPLQGTHPPGAEKSALAHVLDGAQVMPEEHGLFLDGSWRLHPRISNYTSEVFYEGRLHSHDGRELLQLNGIAPLTGTGVRFIPVSHKGRSSESYEEVSAASALLQALLDSGATYQDAEGVTHSLTRDDVLLITPYNDQVRALGVELPEFRIGTVDKFQGQEAPISIYSMATSSIDEAPRGMEFLYSLNRLNVATSRAQCLAVVIASPEILRVRCRTPQQMRLANALARLVEMAEDQS